MRPYSELDAPARLRRLRAVAHDALRQWPVDVTGVRLLNHFENTTFRVDTRQGRFLLRLHRPGYRTRRQIEAELTWLRALGPRFHTQQPQSPDVVDARAPGVPGGRMCTLLSWVDGRMFTKNPSPSRCRRIGVLSAELHRFSASWRPELDRPVFDTSDVFDLDRALADPAVAALLPDWSAWRAGCARLQTLLDALGQSPQAYGLIHLDLHFFNLLHSGDRIVPIDFDDGGWGHYALDLTIPWSRIHRLPDAEPRWAAFVDGYASVRPLPPLKNVPELARLERMVVGPWLAGQTSRPRVRDLVPRVLGEIDAELRSHGLG